MNHFEGPEKRLFLHFTFTTSSNRSISTIRNISKDQWSLLLSISKCNILNHIVHKSFDAYLLSESSLFVYDTFVIIKTCGITSPFELIPRLREIVEDIGAKMETVFYCHREFIYPEMQPSPHTTFDDEIVKLKEILGDLRQIEKINLGKWFGVIYGNISKITSFYEISMTQIKDKPFNGKMLSFLSSYDEYYFQPCGYSMNGQRNEKYYTLHITPQMECSYLSVESNEKQEDLYDRMLRRFQPENAIIVELINESSKNRGNIADMGNRGDEGKEGKWRGWGEWGEGGEGGEGREDEERGREYEIIREEIIELMGELSLRIKIFAIKNT